MSMKHYAIKLEEISKRHLEWIKTFSELHLDTVSYEIQDELYFWRDTYSVTYYSDNYLAVSQMANFVINKIQVLNHIARCAERSTGRKYWVLYSIRTLQMVMKNLLKKVLKNTTSKNISKSS